MLKLNSNDIINKYFHHNKKFIAFCFENCINIFDIVNKEKIHLNKTYQQITENTQYLFVSNSRFIFTDVFPNKIYYCKIINKKVEIIKDIEFTKLSNIKIIVLLKINKDKIIILYVNEEKLYITNINLKDSDKNDFNNDTKKFSINNQNKYKSYFTKKYIYVNISDKENIFLKYNIITNKSKKINIGLKNYEIIQFGKNIYLVLNNDSEKQIYNTKQKLIETINQKNINLIYLSKTYTIYLDTNNNNNKLTIKNKISNVENNKIIDFYHSSIASEKTILTKNMLIMQVNYDRIMMLDLDKSKNFKVTTNFGNIYNYNNYVNKINKDYIKFNVFLPNFIIHNKKIVGTFIYKTEIHKNPFNTHYLSLTSYNKTRIFKSNYNNVINNEYTPSGRNIIKVSDLYVKETNYLKNLAFQLINKNDYSIIMPIYFINGKIQDSQALVSGKILENEDPLDTAQREIYEETGIYVKKNIIHYANESFENFKKQKIYYVCINSKNDIEDKNKFTISNSKDTINKIYVLIIGKSDVLEEIIDMIDYRPPAPDNDKNKDSYIGGIRMISLIDL
jgi:hypothetical protein